MADRKKENRKFPSTTDEARQLMKQIGDLLIKPARLIGRVMVKSLRGRYKVELLAKPVQLTLSGEDKRMES